MVVSSMGSLSKIAPQCAKCSMRNDCTRKRMVMEAYIEEQTMNGAMVSAAQPLLQPLINEEKMLTGIEKAVIDTMQNRFISYGA